jgi:hypothetical protein
MGLYNMGRSNHLPYLARAKDPRVSSTIAKVLMALTGVKIFSCPICRFLRSKIEFIHLAHAIYRLIGDLQNLTLC